MPGGLHIELTGDDVTEVLGGAEEIDDAGLAQASAEFAVGKVNGTLVDFSGNETENGRPARCLAVMVRSYDERPDTTHKLDRTARGA